MGVANRIEHEVQRMRLFSRKRREWKKVSDSRRQKMIAEVNLTDEQKAQIDEIYLANYGKKISYDWHRLYTAYTGRFDPRYFPELLYIPRFEFFMNSPAYAKVFADKNLLPILCVGTECVSVPRTILSRCNGVFRNEKMEPISEKTAMEILEDTGEAFVKPTVDSCSGANCRVVNFSGGGTKLTVKRELPRISLKCTEEILSSVKESIAQKILPRSIPMPSILSA